VSAVLTGIGIRYEHIGNKRTPALAYKELTLGGTTERHCCKFGK
jgi:hypothetical protein